MGIRLDCHISGYCPHGLEQTVNLSAGSSALRDVTEQSVLPADDERANGTFRSIVVDRQAAVIDVAFQAAPVTDQRADGFTQLVLVSDLWLRFFATSF